MMSNILILLAKSVHHPQIFKWTSNLANNTVSFQCLKVLGKNIFLHQINDTK